MISRYCTPRVIRTLERPGSQDAVSADFYADGLEGFVTLTQDEVAKLRRSLAAGKRLVLTISEDPST